MRLVNKPHPSDIPVIVEIDDESLEKFGQWPWPRYLLSDLIEKILASDAAAVGLDILLSEPDRSSPYFLQKSLKDRSGNMLNLENIPDEYLDNDAWLASVMKDKPVVIGAFGIFASGKTSRELPKGAGIVEMTPPGAPDPKDTITRINGLIAPLPVFSNAAPIGIFNAQVEEDGVIRSIPLLVQTDNQVYPALSLRTLMSALGSNTLILNSDENGLSSLQLGGITIPLSYNGLFRPLFSGPRRTFPYYKASDVLEGKVGPQELKDRMVFVGASSIGLQDVRATPLDSFIPGVEVHANLIDNMISGKHVSLLPWNQELQAGLIILSAILSLALFSLLPAAGYAFISPALIVAWLFGSFTFFDHGLFISPVYAVLAEILTGFFVIPVRLRREQKAKMRIKGAFSHYVAPEVVNRIAENGAKALSGESRNVTVLFTDVRNFSSISENMKPDQLVRLLNRYFTPMTASVISHEGTLDKFIGDALMAFWNAPLDVDLHQKKAVLAALDMHKVLKTLRPQFLREFGAEIKIGAGIHSGVVQVGNMGSNDLLNYTCIGDTVNVASRLEGICKHYGADIIVSSMVMANCPDLYFRKLDKIRVKGISRPLEIYTPIIKDIDEAIEHQWKSALDLYFTGEFAKAIQIFEKLQNIEDLKKAASLFIARGNTLLDNPPEVWEGVWTYTSK